MNLKAIFPFLSWYKLVTRESLKADFMAGLTGAVIVLPQGVAFATIAGLPPEYGLYTAMVTPIIAALFGSSFHLISGPTTAISIVFFTAISHHAEPGTPEFIKLALTLTFLAGIFQFSFGLARLGALVNFVSGTVVTGFTAGAAILIVTSQMENIVGVDVENGSSFIYTWSALFDNLESFNNSLIIIALVTLFTAISVKKLLPRFPNLLIGMIAGSITALFLNNETSGIQLVGELPASLPPLSTPEFSFETIRMLAPEAFAVALLGLIEAVSISRSIAIKSHQRVEPTQEFIGQGLSNMVGSFFSNYAGSGSFTRSGINYESGAKTPLSAIFAALLLMVIVLLVAPLTAYLPIASMGGVILIVAYNLVDFKHIYKTLLFSKSESSILLTTFFSTLFLELEFAIYLGVILSLVLFLVKTSTPRIPTISIDVTSREGKRKFTSIKKIPLKQCPQLKIIRIDMSIYFGSVNHIQKRLSQIEKYEKIKHILIVSSGINFVDLTGVEMLIAEHQNLEEQGGGLYFVDLKTPVLKFATKSYLIETLGKDHFFESKTKAIRKIYEQLDMSICETCDAKIFNECQGKAELSDGTRPLPNPEDVIESK